MKIYIKPSFKEMQSYLDDILVISLNDEESLGFDLEEGDEIW